MFLGFLVGFCLGTFWGGWFPLITGCIGAYAVKKMKDASLPPEPSSQHSRASGSSRATNKSALASGGAALAGSALVSQSLDEDTAMAVDEGLPMLNGGVASRHDVADHRKGVNMMTEITAADVLCHGKIKWFSATKGFGFIVDAEGNDWYVGRQSLPNGYPVMDNDEVTFAAGRNAKGPFAFNVKLVISEEERKRASRPVNGHPGRHSMIVCPEPTCHRNIVPRLVFYRGVLQHSVCPFCGTQVENFRKMSKTGIVVIICCIIVVVGRLMLPA